MAIAYADLTWGIRQLSAHVIVEPPHRVRYCSNLVIADLLKIAADYAAHNVTNKADLIARLEQNVQLWIARDTATQFGMRRYVLVQRNLPVHSSAQ